MGDISIIARRLMDGHVQYGWSGNGGYYSMVGDRLLRWYQDRDMVEYLFGLGQMQLIGAPGSEKGGFGLFETHWPINKPHYLGTTERDIFSKIAFVDYGYFYDLDEKWYYILPGPYFIKAPLELIKNNISEDENESDFRIQLGVDVVEYILGEYYQNNADFQQHIKEYDIQEVKENMVDTDWPLSKLYEKYRTIYDYFDDWVLVCSDDKGENITDIILRKKEDYNDHIETIEWK